jgi:hypothetical protein
MLNINTRLGYRPYVHLTERRADVHQVSAYRNGAVRRPPG